MDKLDNDFSYLPASGFTKTNTLLHEFASRVVAEAKSRFGDNKIKAGVWSYREQGREFLSCDLFSIDESIDICMPITICAEGEYCFDMNDEPDVIDMAEAVHLAGIITKALDAVVEIGRLCNEVNECVLEFPLKDNETNGHINLWKKNQDR